MALFNPEVMFVLLSSFIIIKLSKIFSIPHLILKGIKFWITPSNEALSMLIPPKGKKEKVSLEEKLKQKEEVLPAQVRRLMDLSSGTITSDSLYKHLFFNELNTVSFLMVMLMSTFLFTSLIMYLGICPSSITLYISVMTFTIAVYVLSIWVIKQNYNSFEVKLVILVSIIGFIICLLTISFNPSFIDNTLVEALDDITYNMKRYFVALKIESFDGLNTYTLGISFSIFVGVLTGLILMPTIRFVQTYLNYISNPDTNVIMKFVFHIAFALPIIIYLSYYKPLLRDFILPDDLVKCNNESISKECKVVETDEYYMNEEDWITLRVYIIIIFILLKLLLFRSNIQEFLKLAHSKDIEEDITNSLVHPKIVKDLTGKKDIVTVDIKSHYTNVYSYLCIASTQYLAPLSLFLSLVVILIRYGNINLHIFDLLKYLSLSPIVNCKPSESITEKKLQHFVDTVFVNNDVSHIKLFTPLVYRSITNFMLFWLFGCLVVESTLSIVYWRSYQPGGLLYKQHKLNELNENKKSK